MFNLKKHAQFGSEIDMMRDLASFCRGAGVGLCSECRSHIEKIENPEQKNSLLKAFNAWEYKSQNGMV